MKKSYIKTLILFSVFLFTKNTFSQTSNLLYYLETLPQSNYLNPALTPRANGFLGFPGFSSFAMSIKSDIAPKDLIQKSGNSWLLPIDQAFNYNDLYKSIGKSALINTKLSYAPIYFGFRTGKGYFTFSLKQKADLRLGIPKDIFTIAEKGFNEGANLDFKTFETKLTAYHEISFGYAHKIDDKLTVGAHFKPLSGIAAAHMKFDKFNIKNNRTSYELELDGKALSSVPFLKVTPDEDGFPENVDTEDDLESSDYVNNVKPNFSNFGIALDLGAVYEFNSKFTFSASLNNLGYIKWKSNLNSTSVKGSYTYTGPDITIAELDDMDEVFEDILDEMDDSLEGVTAKESFSTGLSPELFLGSAYHVNHVFDLGFLSKSTFAKYNFRQEFILSANLNLYKALSANIAYNHEIKGSKDLGLGLALRAGPAQFYILANHIPLSFDKIVDGNSKYLVPTSMESFSIMTGINFVFGKHGYKNKPMIDN